MRHIISFFRRQNFPFSKLIILVTMSFLLSLLALAQPEVLRRITHAISIKDGKVLQGILVSAIAIAVLLIGMSFWRDIYMIKTSNAYQQILSRKMIDHLLMAELETIQNIQFGDVATAFTRNVERYVNTALEAILLLSKGFFSLLITFIYMCVIEWRLALCILVYNMVIRFLAVFVERKIKKNELEVTKAVQASGNLLSSLMQNMLMVHVYSNWDFFKNKWRNTEQQVMNLNWKNFVWQNGFQDFIWAFSKLAEFVIVYGVGAWLNVKGQTDISILLSFVFVNDLFTIGINDISYSMVNRAQAEAYQLSLEEILSMEIQEHTSAKEEKTPVEKDKPFAVRFDHVFFAYGGHRVLEDVSFCIRPGEKVLIKGTNGQGKSTLLKLMAGLYSSQKGKIYYGEYCISDWQQKQLAEVRGYMSQHSNILSGGVKENISVSSQVDEDRVASVLKKLKLYEIMHNNPNSLSMGEQQRVNIGRTFYKGRKGLLLCDEIFSNINQEYREMILKELRDNFTEATVVMITHEKVDFVFDRVFEVNNGIVTEVG